MKTFLKFLVIIFLPLSFSNPLKASELLQDAEELVKSTWTTYKNSEYGFEFSYPDSLHTSSEFLTSSHITDKWSHDAEYSLGTGTAIVSVPVLIINNTEDVYPKYFWTEVRIGISNNPNTVKNCVLSTENSPSNSSLNINNVNFQVFNIEEAGMMQYAKGLSYRTVHDNKCFVIEQIKAGSNRMSNPNPQDISDKILESYYYLTGKIIKTFKFIN
ncbi:hypothetical protein NOVO_08675 [Rickettsiales bacterium Ac37b]|nr:hypothetical protein NOVO_08675 [Rickettsiales bacterium Ac37b]